MGYSFISGATGGIGKAYCQELAKMGDNLFLTATNGQRLLELKQELVAINGNIDIKFFACDLFDEEQRQNLFNFAVEQNITFSKIILVAGIDTQKAFIDYSREKLNCQLRVNGESTIDLCYLLLKRKEENCQVISISSMSAVSPMPYFAVYSATKIMLHHFFVGLHYELKKQGVNITVVMPGGVFTRKDIIDEIKSQGFWGKLSAKQPEFIVKKSLKAVKNNKLKCIPGFWNKFLYFMIKITPKKFVLWFIAKRWKSHSKEAY